ncbi:hypothetical protein [Rhizobium leguminosarum]|uniref:hypothetical protein n=1 Tax=Rhizobium leguminosarum TaxID=384 RepID=UPI001C94E862|nr:hypothetical protein [Rhizobium leguminosarum]MBY5700410.1 hypothetical protein [Rhizobium leguminosarum]
MAIYFPNGNWKKVREKGLDESNRELRLELDLVSDSYLITIECQSSLHDPNTPKLGFAAKTTIDEIARRDQIKRKLGKSKSRFAGYSHVEIWFELSAVRKLARAADRAGRNPIEAIVDEFKEFFAKAGVTVPDKPLPLAEQLFAAFSDRDRIREELAELSLTLDPGAWLGLGSVSVACDVCGHAWTSTMSQLRRGASRGRNGCFECWRGVHLGNVAQLNADTWAAFKTLCDENSIEIVAVAVGGSADRVTLQNLVDGQIVDRDRHNAQDRLQRGLPIFNAHAEEYEKRREKTKRKMLEYDQALSPFGIKLAETDPIPTSMRDENGNIKTNLLKIRYLACDHVLPVNIGTFIKRLEGHRSRKPDGKPAYCEECQSANVALERTKWLHDLASMHGLELVGEGYVGADNKNRYRFRCPRDCGSEHYEAAFSNLTKRGIACQGCRDWRNSVSS